MNGAMAEPLLNTRRPPTAIISRNSGSSQNFLCSRTNSQNSMRNATSRPLELLCHRLRRRPCGLAPDPIARCRGVALQPQWVLAAQLEGGPDRYKADAVDQRHQHRIDDVVQRQSQPEPYAVEGRQQLRTKKSCRHEQTRQPERPSVWPVATND